MKKTCLLFTFALFLTYLSSSLQLNAQAFRAVNDTIDLYPGVPKTVNLLENDTVPLGDSLKVIGGGATGSAVINFTQVYLGFFTYTVKPLWGFNGNVSGYYRLTDFTLGKVSQASIFFRIHDHSYDSLDINNVKAAITAYGMQFNLPADFVSIFKVPGDGQKGTIYSASLWIGGKGNDSSLYLAAEKYKQGPFAAQVGTNPDFYAGPVMDSINYSVYQDTAWSRTWKIRKTEIEYHKTHWNSPGYTAPLNILTWPGNGNTAYGEAAELAPYHDNNGDHHYNPADGDYPLIRGDEAIFSIFNDDRDIHKETGGKKLKAEIHLMAYAFDFPTDSAFNNTIFFHYDIFNRSDRTYNNTYLGLYTDFDIGWYKDDYLISDVERNSLIGYNGLPTDGSGQAGTYGPHPPAQSVTVLAGPFMDPTGHDRPRLDNTGHQICNESVNGTGFGDSIPDNERYGITNSLSYIGTEYLSPPSYAPEYYHSMQSFLYDSTHLYYGGMGKEGYGGYGPDCRFMFPGRSDSLNWGTGCQLPNGAVNWTMETAGIAPQDMLGMGSMGPFTFKPGDVQQLDLAFVFARDYTGQDTLQPSVDKLRQMIDIVKNSYTTGLLPDGNSFFGINEKGNNAASKIKIYPNPANGQVNILFDRTVNEAVSIRILNTSGAEVFSSRLISPGKNIQLDVSGLLPGLYIISIQTNAFVDNEKIIILK